MVNYNCPRCGYITDHKNSMKNHLKRKNICNPLFEDISISEIESTVFKKDVSVYCKYCENKFSTVSSRRRHEKTCIKKVFPKNLKDIENHIKILQELKKLKIKEEKIKIKKEKEEKIKKNKEKITKKEKEKDIKINKLKKQLENKTLLINTDKKIIRNQSRTLYKKSGLSLKCLNCNYSKHVHICHIKEIKNFNSNDKVTDINKLSNLVALCSNCHFEMDKLKNFEIIRKVKLHSFLINVINS